MKPLRIVVPIALVLLLAVAWVSTIRNLTSEQTELNRRIAIADSSYEKGLYQQAIMEYKDAIAAGMGLDGYERVKEVYQKYLEEEPDNQVAFESYLEDMAEVTSLYPEAIEYWELLLDYYLDTNDYEGAFGLVKSAYEAGVSSEKLDACYEELRYQTELLSDGTSNLKTAFNGFGIAQDEEGKWRMTDAFGGYYDEYGYDLVSLPNDDGEVLRVNKLGPRLLDGSGIVRARFDDLNITGAGMYDNTSMLLPVQIDKGKDWHYLDVGASLAESRSVVWDETYEEAGTFEGGRAAVKSGNGWHLIDTAGNAVSDTFEDIKLNPHGGYVQSGLVFAKRGGLYGIYDSDLNRLGDFSCDDIDLNFGELVAYESGGRWGFVAIDGDGGAQVVLEPQYRKARSFFNGMAAVAEKDHSWGFINADLELKVPYEYYDAFYFAYGTTALVCTDEDVYGCLGFIYT